MKKHPILMLLMTLFCIGCYETKLDYTINPDGTGKVLVEVKSASVMDMNQSGGETALAKDVLKNAAGIDTWKEIEVKKTDDGKNYFKGTAYFKDITKVRFKSISMMDSVNFYKDAQSNLILEIGNDSKSEQKTAEKSKMSKEEQDKYIAEQKGQFQQMKPMLGAILGTMKTDVRFRIPGKIEKTSNFAKEKDGSLRITFDGQKMLNAFDKLLADDAWWRQQILAGSDLKKNPPSGFEINEQLFGEKGPVRATAKGKFQTFFDYTKEMTAAQDQYDAMIVSLGLSDASAKSAEKAVPYKGGNFKNVKIVRTALSNLSDPDYNMFGNDQSCRLSLMGELPGALLSADKAVLTKATADNGDDLLQADEWSRETTFLQLSQNKTFVLWDVSLLLPGPKVKGIQELSGFVYASSAQGSKSVSSGIMQFKEGEHGTSFDVSIESIKSYEGSQEIYLRFNSSCSMIKDVQVLDPIGNILETQKYSTSNYEEGCSMSLYYQGTFPARGSFKIEVYEDIQHLEIPFKITNVSLFGIPTK